MINSRKFYNHEFVKKLVGFDKKKQFKQEGKNVNKLTKIIFLFQFCVLFNLEANALEQTDTIKNTNSEAAQIPIPLDIKGLKLGMSYDDGRTFLQTVTTGNISDNVRTIYTSNSQFKEQIKYKSSISSYKPGKTSSSREDYVLLFPPLPNESTVVGLVRNIIYPPKESPNKDGFVRALEGKYGEPSDSYSRGRGIMENQVMIWAYDEKNQKLHSNKFKNELSVCILQVGHRIGTKEVFNFLNYQKNQRRSMDVCRSWTVLSATFKAYPDGSGQLRTSLINHAEARRVAEKSMDYFSQIEKEKEMKVKQKMEQNTPSL